MPQKIHPTAIIGKNVWMGQDCEIGPHAVIEDDVTLGEQNKIMANAYLCRGTEIGSQNEIHIGAVIGHTPQDLTYKGQKTFAKIGNGNVIREYVTIHRSTKEEMPTGIGNNNFLMANAHVAHDCQIGDHVIFANIASLAGHCIIEDQVFLSHATGCHQFVRIGRLVMVGAVSGISKDIPPYMTCAGQRGIIRGLNVIGLRRAGIGQKIRSEIKQAYKLLYRSGLNTRQALKEIENAFSSPEIRHLVRFVRESKRGICAAGDEIRDDRHTQTDAA